MFPRISPVIVLLGVLQQILADATFNCYVCTYTLSSDPKLDYECVNQPWNVTKGLPSVSCTSPYQCVTRATFNQGATQVRSVSRSCLPQDSICKGESCCNTDGVYQSCEHKCREDMCNNRNAEEWLHRGGSSGAQEIHSFVASLVVSLTCLTYLLV